MKKTLLFTAILWLCLSVQSCQKEKLQPLATSSATILENPNFQALQRVTGTTRWPNTSPFCPFENFQLEKTTIADEIIAAYQEHIQKQQTMPIIHYPPSPYGQPDWATSFKMIGELDTPIYVTALSSPRIPFPVGFLLTYEKEGSYQFLRISNPSLFFTCLENIISGND